MGPADADFMLAPVFRYSTISAVDQPPTPSRMLLPRPGADQCRPASPPSKGSLCFVPPNQLSGVWHAPQWASPCTRYAPRFHAADCVGSPLYSPSSKNSRFQPNSSPRQRKTHGRRFVLSFCTTGATVSRYALIASTSARVTLVHHG